MKHARLLLAVFLVISLTPGCVSTGGYFTDRGRDLIDVVTLGVEATSYGLAAQVGPVLGGAFSGDGKGFGIRSGIVGIYDSVETTSPFGGMKQSLWADHKAQGKAVIDFFTEAKIVTERYWPEPG